VVLVDFWTYSCINCIRTLPHVTGWYDKYKDQGFVVIGVHTPEFAFEQKDRERAETRFNQFKIHYPVAQDNTYDRGRLQQPVLAGGLLDRRQGPHPRGAFPGAPTTRRRWTSRRC